MFDEHINDRIPQLCNSHSVSKYAGIDRGVSIGFVKSSSFSGNRYAYLQLVMPKQVSFSLAGGSRPCAIISSNFPLAVPPNDVVTILQKIHLCKGKACMLYSTRT